MAARRFETIANGDVDLNVAVQGDGPLIVCVHGWPELWYSWRHQLDHFGGGAGGGYTVAALDVRGYGGSSAPHAISAYTLRELASDVVAVIDALGGGEPAILLGHDWGAPIVWNTARLHPDKVRAVCGLSVPYFPVSTGDPIETWRAIYEANDKFFYMVYFQEEGVAEAELGADTLRSLRMIYDASSGAPSGAGMNQDKPAGAAMLDGLVDPEVFPAWATPEDLQVFADGIDAHGWRGPLNRYRAQGLDAEDLGALPNPNLTQPAAFIGGEFDVVRSFNEGIDPFDYAELACDDFRGTTIISGVGHWVQQEAPEATNAAIADFLAGLA